MNNININIGLNKIRGFFSKSIKEIINTEDGKRNLYFDYNRRNYIKFSLDVATTCESIFRVHKDEIKKNIEKIYGNNIDLNNFAFLVVELNSNRFDGTQNLINVKLRKDDNILFRVLSNSQLMLCYIFMNRQNITLKKNVRNYGLSCSLNTQNLDSPQKPNETIKKEIKIYYPKNQIFYYNYNAYAFSKEKIQINEEEVAILAKPVYKILIKDIKSVVSFLSTDENDSKQYLKNYKIYGEKPIFCAEIETKDNKKLLLGKNNNEQLKVLVKALDRAICNYQNQYLTFDVDNKINQQFKNTFLSSNELIQKSSFISELIINNEKRNSMFPNIKRKEFDDIITNIINFKNNLRNQKYLDCIVRLRLIIDIINNIKNEENNNNINFLSSKNIEYIKGVWEKINTFLKLKTNIKDNNNNTNKKENEISSINENINKIQKLFNDDDCEKILGKDFINKYNIMIESIDKLNEFNLILNMHIFDNLYYEIKTKIISNIYDANKNKNNNDAKNLKIVKDDKLILGNCFINDFQMKKEEDFYNIGEKEIENIFKNFKNKLIFENEGEITAF